MKVWIRGGIGFEPSFVNGRDCHSVQLAFAVTCHKGQGRTIPRLILAVSKRPHGMKILSFEALFVALSRVKTSEHIRFLCEEGDDLSYLTKLKCSEFLLSWRAGFGKSGDGKWDPKKAVAHFQRLEEERRSAAQKRSKRRVVGFLSKKQGLKRKGARNKGTPNQKRTRLSGKAGSSDGTCHNHEKRDSRKSVLFNDKNINGVVIQRDDWESFSKGSYITDRVIDAFISLLPQSDSKVVLQSWFFPAVSSSGWDSALVQQFNGMAPLGTNTPLIVIPCHSLAHWSILVRRMSPSKKEGYEFIYLDSLNKSDNDRFEIIMREIRRSPLYDEKRGDKAFQCEVPKQEELECGAFSCLYAYVCIMCRGDFMDSLPSFFSGQNTSYPVRSWVESVLRESRVFDPTWIQDKGELI